MAPRHAADEPMPQATSLALARSDIDQRTIAAPSETRTTAVPDWFARPFAFELEMSWLDKVQCSSPVYLGVDGASTNYAEVGWDGDGLARVSFTAKQPRLALLVDTGHLRKISIESGTRSRISIGGFLGPHPRTTNDAPPPLTVGPHSNCAAFRDHDAFAAFGQGYETDDVEDGSWSCRCWDSTVGLGGAPNKPWRRIVRGSIEGTVVDARDLGVDRVPVVLLGNVPATATTANGGRFVFADLQPGTWSLRAGTTSLGTARGTVSVVEGPALTRLQLDRGAFLAGRVVAPDGTPLAGRRILWSTPAGDWRNDVSSGADGTFVLANLPTTPGSLWACNGREYVQLPAAGLQTVVPDGNEVLLHIDPTACRGTLRVTPFVPDGIPADHIAVRAWQIESGLGAHLSRPVDGTVHELTDLPAGFYAVELVGPGIGVVPIGQHWVDGRSVCDLGVVAVPAPGRVTFGLAPEDLAAGDQQHFEVYQLRPDIDLFMRLLQPREAEHLLPAGDYAVAWRHRDQQLRFERFTVANGAAQVVRLQ